MEIWKDIVGYENIYQCSSFGNIKSICRVTIDKNGFEKKIKNRILKPLSQKSGHLHVALCKNGKVKTCLIHRIIGSSFLEKNNEDESQIRHLDGNPKNNNVKNLKWGTRSDNSCDMYHVHGKRIGVKSHFSKYTAEEIAKACKLKGTCSSNEAFKKTGISPRYIRNLWSEDTGYHRHVRVINTLEDALAFTN
jgi:hypothetical protein